MLKLLVVQRIIQIGDKRLAEKSVEIPKNELTSKENLALYQDLLDTCNNEQEGTAGLSAVQLGVLKRVYVVRRMDVEQEESGDVIWSIMINPTVRIIGSSESTIWEGCMSVGEGSKRLFGPVTRADHVEVTYLDQDGVDHKEEFTGYMAHIIQHEQDHLEGILFLKYVKAVDRLWTSVKLDRYLETHDHFPPSE